MNNRFFDRLFFEFKSNDIDIDLNFYLKKAELKNSYLCTVLIFSFYIPMKIENIEDYIKTLISRINEIDKIYLSDINNNNKPLLLINNIDNPTCEFLAIQAKSNSTAILKIRLNLATEIF